MLSRYILPIFSIAFILAAGKLSAQKVVQPTNIQPEWSKPYQPFRVAGNLYYVGTHDLGCYLITGSKGHILINTGLADSESIIVKNIQQLGFKLTDVKILLTTQAHFDHMGAMAVLKKRTKAKFFVNSGDAQVIRDGGSSDYALGNGTPTYVPVSPDKLLQNNSVVSLGDIRLTLLSHPGHTKGSCSYLLNTSDNKRSYRVLIANMPTIVTDQSFGKIPAYPTIQHDYAKTLANMKGLKFDIWVASHASQFGLHQKHQPADAYNPTAFMDQQGYINALNDLQQAFDKKIDTK